MTTPETITAYRAAAAKLGEALAYTGTSPNGAAAIISEAEALAGGHLTPQGEGIGLFGNWRDHYNSHYGGWRWIVETAQLRLLVEALLLEQEAQRRRIDWRDLCVQLRTEPPTCQGCGMPDGAFHVEGCDWDQCPTCNRPLSSECTCKEEQLGALVRGVAEGVGK